MIRRLLLPAGLLVVTLTGGCSTALSAVAFPLGAADRDLTYCNSEKLDLFIPRAAVTRPLPIAIYVHEIGRASCRERV